MMLGSFRQKGKASFIVGGQFGSESKGAAAAWTAFELSKHGKQFDIVTSGASAQAGHTSIHRGVKRVVYHLPTAPFIVADEFGSRGQISYINSGSLIDPESLEKEIADNTFNGQLFIHPMAGVITDECREAERKIDSAQTAIASTRKGVGEALSRKVLRKGLVAKDHPYLKQFVKRIDLNLHLHNGKSVLVEVPQGVSLSLNHSKFYPFTTSRDCIPSSAMGDAGIHPSFYGQTMVVLRTYPIRVGNIEENGEVLGRSGDFYPDQFETSWRELGVEAEITTVTKRIRRVFTFSIQQVIETFALCRPDVVFLSFCNYVKDPEYLDAIIDAIKTAARVNGMRHPELIYEWGPTTEDVGDNYVRD